MESKPDVIVITARYEADVSADRAVLFVTIQGTSLVTGRAALSKAREVKSLVDALASAGVDEGDIGLEGVNAHVSSGLLGKSSSATYRLRVQVTELDALPEVLGAITSAKNAQLDRLVWRYPESAEQQAHWLELCIAQANTKARAAATALGVRLVGVHRLTEQLLGDADLGVYPQAQAAYGAPLTAMRSAAPDMGFDLSHHKRGGMTVSVEYRVEGFESAAAPA
ncbi:MAG TPA: SIMPL domain-containing protein [Polyangiaceae bacterium]|nr:SIMPL domain-containing protein [Polyangiaceae bacterium]